MRHPMIFILYLISISVYAQPTATPNQIRATNVIDRISSTGIGVGDMIIGIPMPEGKRVTDFYFDKYWNKSTIEIYATEKTLDGYWVKYDMKNNFIEVIFGNRVRVLTCDKVKVLIWLDSLTQKPRYFVNPKELEKNLTEVGLMELLVEGNYQLVKRIELILRKPDYIPALNLGSRDESLIRKTHLYVAAKGVLTEIKNKNDLFSVKEESRSALSDFMKMNKLSINREEDLARIVVYLNSL